MYYSNESCLTDGWETVKGRSRWRLTQSSGNIKARTMTAGARFYLPSPATSLPALTMAAEDSEPESDSKPPAKLHKDQQNQEIARANKVPFYVNVSIKI